MRVNKGMHISVGVTGELTPCAPTFSHYGDYEGRSVDIKLGGIFYGVFGLPDKD